MENIKVLKSGIEWLEKKRGDMEKQYNYLQKKYRCDGDGIGSCARDYCMS
ncbi:MAG: hypothetical protein J6C64_06050 [Lachnospiraceae bacterium]|nr:hypothetical protein [Lachnospiraceae bacterium]